MILETNPCEDDLVTSSDQEPLPPSFYHRESEEWQPLDRSDTQEGSQDTDAVSESFRSQLLASLQMRNLVVLAGSGTSLGRARGPSMSDLWKSCLKCDSDSGQPSELGEAVLAKIGYVVDTHGRNIEALLSRCDAYQQLHPDAAVRDFVRGAKQVILTECSAFLLGAREEQLAAHSTFLHRMSRRRARDPRLKLFTTNYDLCFETAAAHQASVPITGFSFTEPRYFDPRFFDFDIVRRSAIESGAGTPVEGVFHLYKLHGSVNWNRVDAGHIEMAVDPPPDTAVLVYPADGKYQQSYVQPHLELMSQYLAALREPNTCVVVIGFGFNDSHLSEPLLSAIRANPHLRVIVVDWRAKENSSEGGDDTTNVWRTLMSRVRDGYDMWLVNATFSQFARVIPDLRALSAGERLRRSIRDVAGGGGGRGNF